MTSNKYNHGGCGTVRERDPRRKAPRVVLAGGPGFAEQAAHYLDLMGLDVCSAGTTEDLHKLAIRPRTAAIVLPAETKGESGFLTCAKLRITRPKLKLVLVGDPTPRMQRFAGFVGAGFATEAEAGDAVMKLI